MAQIDYNAYAQAIKESLQDSLLTAVGKYGTPPLATGKLLNSIRVDWEGDGYGIYMESYGLIVDKGRNPSKLTSKAIRSAGKPLAPPIQPILEWVRTKRIGGGREDVAYAIQNSLRYKRIAPRPFIERGIQESISVVGEDIVNDISKQLDNVFK
jgi:hypothetical protein